MKDLSLFDDDKTMTVKEVAEALGTADSTIRNHVKKLFPSITKNGEKTRLNQEQITEIKKSIVPRDLTLKSKVESVKTDLEMYEQAAGVLQWMAGKVEEQKKALEAAQPKIEFYDTVMESTDTVDMKDAAKILNLSYGRNILFEILRKKKILMVNNQPYQEYINRGYFRVIERPWTLPNGEPKISKKTVVFQKGLEYIKKVVSK
jgi:phage antirepressor YoqD-like protein